MLKHITSAMTFTLLAAPLAAIAGPISIQNDGSYHLEKDGKSQISHQWRGTLPIEFDKKIVIDRTKKERCTHGTCTSFELLTEMTVKDLGEDAIQMDVDFTNTAGDDVSRLTGSLVTRVNNSAKLELKTEGTNGDRFSLHLSPRIERPTPKEKEKD